GSSAAAPTSAKPPNNNQLAIHGRYAASGANAKGLNRWGATRMSAPNTTQNRPIAPCKLRMRTPSTRRAAPGLARHRGEGALAGIMITVSHDASFALKQSQQTDAG